MIKLKTLTYDQKQLVDAVYDILKGEDPYILTTTIPKDSDIHDKGEDFYIKCLVDFSRDFNYVCSHIREYYERKIYLKEAARNLC